MLNSRVLKTAAALVLAVFVRGSVAAAQAPVANRVPAGVGEIIGNLVDSVNHRPVAGGSVTVRRVGDSSFAGGALPKPDGSFRVDGLVPGRYSLRVRAIGFAQIVKNDLVITREAPSVD